MQDNHTISTVKGQPKYSCTFSIVQTYPEILKKILKNLYKPNYKSRGNRINLQIVKITHP
jgi:hypothetical protein